MTSTEEQQAQAVIAAITAALPGGRKAFDYDETPAVLPVEGFVLVDVTRRFVGDGFRRGGPNGLRGGRVGCRYVARTVTDTRALRARTRGALEDVVLTAGGGPLGPFLFESADPIGDRDDQGWWEATDLFTFTCPA